MVNSILNYYCATYFYCQGGLNPSLWAHKRFSVDGETTMEWYHKFLAKESSHSILLFPGVEPGELQGKGTSKTRGGMEAERVLQLLGGPAGTLGPLRR